MINDLKLGIRMLPYAYGRTGAIACGAIFGGLGLLICLLGGSPFSGGFYLVLTAMYPVQLLYSLDVSNMVLTSSLRKKMQTSAPAVMNCVCVTIMYTLFLAIQIVWMMCRPERISIVCNELMGLSLVIVGVMIYAAVAYKSFVVSMLSFLVLFIVLFFSKDYVSSRNLWDFGQEAGSFVIAALIGYVAIVFGSFLEYGASLLVYKWPLSKLGQPATLRKYL